MQNSQNFKEALKERYKSTEKEQRIIENFRVM